MIALHYRNWRAQAAYHIKTDSGTLLVGALWEEPSCEGLFTLVKLQQEPLLEVINQLEIMAFFNGTWISMSFSLPSACRLNRTN